jgi:Zn-dependent protease with chaperone function
MLILGLLLVAAGVLLLLAAVFTAETTGVGAAVEIVGTEVGAVTLFLLGLGAGIAILWGLSLAKFGARRSLRQRREQQRLTKLSEQLDKVEAERRHDHDDEQGSPRI